MPFSILILDVNYGQVLKALPGEENYVVNVFFEVRASHK